MIKILILSICLSGCVETGLRITESCTDDERAAIHHGVMAINVLAGDSIVTLDNNGSFPVVCYHDAYEWPYGDDSVGHFNNEQLSIASFRREGDGFTNTFMHELGHYVGAWHVNGSDNVMSKNATDIIQYTDEDERELLR